MTDYIFVVGKHRSGTTWLGNMIASSSAVSTVIDPDFHRGVCESSFFTHLVPYAKKGNLSLPAVLELLTSSRFYKLSSVTVDCTNVLTISHSIDELCANFLAAIAESKLSQESTKYFLEKTPANIFEIDKLAALFPTAKFIIVQREARDVLISNAKRFPEYRGVIGTIRFSIVYGAYLKIGDHFARKYKPRSLKVRYSSLYVAAQREEICAFLRLPERELRSDFEPKSSMGLSHQIPSIAVWACKALSEATRMALPSRVILLTYKARVRIFGRRLPNFFTL